MARYSRSASKDVKSAMRRRKKGTLKSGKGQGRHGQEPQAGDRHSGFPRHARRARRCRGARGAPEEKQAPETTNAG